MRSLIILYALAALASTVVLVFAAGIKTPTTSSPDTGGSCRLFEVNAGGYCTRPTDKFCCGPKKEPSQGHCSKDTNLAELNKDVVCHPLRSIKPPVKPKVDSKVVKENSETRGDSKGLSSAKSVPESSKGLPKKAGGVEPGARTLCGLMPGSDTPKKCSQGGFCCMHDHTKQGFCSAKDVDQEASYKGKYTCYPQV